MDAKHLVRFEAKYVINPATGCWDWTAGKIPGSGYPVFAIDCRSVRAHRTSYEHFVGPIPEGLTLDHLCRNPSCVNPAHLEPVTQRENILRGNNRCAQNARQTECIRGHPLAGENLYVTKTGSRKCKACLRWRSASYRNAQSLPPAQRTHCPQGHAYDEQNTYLHRGRHRVCRTCARVATNRWLSRRRKANTASI